MAFAINDRVKETSTTTGTGTFSLGGAVSGFQTFVAGVGGGNTTYYAIVNDTGTEFEIGIGTVTDSGTDTLSRDTILESSNSDSAVSFSSGTKTVFCTLPAEKVVVTPGSGAMTISPPTDLTVDAGNDIVLDAAGNAIRLKSNGTEVGQASLASQDLTILSSVSDKDLIFKGNDGGSTITALTLDMSAAGAATFNSSVTADGGLIADNITIDGNEIDISSGNLSVDVAGNIILDADGGTVSMGDAGTTSFSFIQGTNSEIDAPRGDLTLDVAGDINLDASGSGINFLVDGTQIGAFENDTQDFVIKSNVSDKDIIFKGNDGGSAITALTLDMSDAGTATFNHDILLGDSGEIKFGASSDLRIYHDGSNTHIKNSGSDFFIATEGSGQDLYLRSDDDILIQPQGGENGIKLIGNGAVEIYHDNTKVFETSATGATLTGVLVGSSDLSLTSSDGNEKILLDASGTQRFNVGGSEEMRLTTSGLGIGESTPLGNLHVKSADSGADVEASKDELVIEGSANSGMTILSGASSQGGIAFGDSGDNDIGRFTYSHSDNSLRVHTNGSEAMRIDSSQNVGIKNSSPSVALDVTGDFKVSGSITIGSTAITSTAAELNFSDGVTSNIQTQLDTKTTSGFALAMAVAL